VNTVLALIDRLATDSEARVLAVAPPTADISLYDLFGTLAAGGTVCYAPELDLADVAGWAKAAEKYDATTWSSAPTLFEAVIGHALQHPCPGLRSLRVAILHGEQPSPLLPERAWAVAPGLRIENLYGAAEASICSVSHQVAAEPPWPAIRRGRPITNQRCYVLDDRMNLCPVGVPGRIALGGLGVGPGYLGLPAVTAERFVPDPYAATAGERLYLTGDIGSWLPDGTLRYVGSLGHKAGAGLAALAEEVTGELLRHRAVHGAVTLPGGQGETGLVSYVASDVSAGQLKFYLTERLPRDLVPELMRLPALPLTGNGRVDLAALPQPGVTRAPYVAPRNPLEAELIDLSAELLEIEQVGMHDNFFKLGGHSLLLAELTGLIANQFEVDITLQDMFTASNFEEIAHFILSAQLANVDASEYAAMIADPATGQEH
jgi:acyl-CoA synthetase (AMP-forming)/AMP-acid ligase II/acyl carrier protein